MTEVSVMMLFLPTEYWSSLTISQSFESLSDSSYSSDFGFDKYLFSELPVDFNALSGS